MNNISEKSRGAKRVNGVSLPRGLWVGKQPRPDRPQRDLDLVPRDMRPWDVWPEDYFPDYRFRLVRKGQKVIKRSTETVDYREAVRRAKVEHELWIRRKWDIRAAALIDTPVKVPTSGEIFQAYLAVYKNKRPVQSARLMYAMANGLVPAVKDRNSREGVIRENSETAKKIDAVPSNVLFSAKTVRAYFAARQGGIYDPMKKAREHLSYNKALKFAREMFTKNAMELCYKDLTLPDLSEYRKFPTLRQVKIDPREKAIAPEAWAKMQRAAKELEQTGSAEQKEIALANWMLRTLALRTNELLYARKSWIWQDPRSKRWYLDIKDRPEEGFTIKGAEAGQVPLAPDLLAVLLARPEGFLFYPAGATPTTRENLLSRDHNAWLKTFIGEIHNRQGNHRLRAHISSYLNDKVDAKTAAAYLRHVDAGKEAKTAMAHYIARQYSSLPEITDADLLAWGRAGGEDGKDNGNKGDDEEEGER